MKSALAGSMGDSAISISALAVALLLRSLLDPVLGHTLPFVTVFGVVALSVWLRGWRHAVLIALAGFVAGSALYPDSTGFRSPTPLQPLLAFTLYMSTCSILIVLGESMRRARTKAVQAVRLAREKHELLEVTLEQMAKAQAALYASEGRLRLAQSAARVGSFEWEIETGTARVTDTLIELYGRPGPFEATLEYWRTLVHPDDQRTVMRRVAQAIHGGDFEAEWRTVLPDGSVRWIAGRASALRRPDGTPERVLGVNIDITERKLAEEELREAARRKDEFLAMLAHELRNPLAPLRNGLEVLKLAPGDTGMTARAMSMMDRQLSQLVRLIDDLLDVSRIARGQLELRRERVELSSIFTAVLESCRSQVDDAGHELVMDAAPETLLLDADPVRLAQVFGNLLNNACRYTPRGGRILLSVRRDGDRVRVSVRDTGVGIPPEMLSKIFDMFTQVDRSLVPVHGGLGIGLGLVRRLVELHGGKVHARSDGVGKGSEFEVELPLAQLRREVHEPLEGQAIAS